jgi:hypothetical protein
VTEESSALPVAAVVSVEAAHVANSASCVISSYGGSKSGYLASKSVFQASPEKSPDLYKARSLALFKVSQDSSSSLNPNTSSVDLSLLKLYLPIKVVSPLAVLFQKIRIGNPSIPCLTFSFSNWLGVLYGHAYSYNRTNSTLFAPSDDA